MWQLPLFNPSLGPHVSYFSILSPSSHHSPLSLYLVGLCHKVSWLHQAARTFPLFPRVQASCPTSRQRWNQTMVHESVGYVHVGGVNISPPESPVSKFHSPFPLPFLFNSYCLKSFIYSVLYPLLVMTLLYNCLYPLNHPPCHPP